MDMDNNVIMAGGRGIRGINGNGKYAVKKLNTHTGYVY